MWFFFFSAVNQRFWLQLPCRSHQTAEAGGRALPSAESKAEDEWTFPSHWRSVYVLIKFEGQKNHLTAALNYLHLKPHFVESCRDLARLAQGWDPSDWRGVKPGESLWTFWESCKRLYLWVHRTIVTAFSLTFSHYMIIIINCVSLYPGPDIWLEYAQYSIGGMGSPGGIDKVRSIFERAVTAVGLHMTKGQMMWEAYREFENAILSTVQVCFRHWEWCHQWPHIYSVVVALCLCVYERERFILNNFKNSIRKCKIDTC